MLHCAICGRPIVTDGRLVPYPLLNTQVQSSEFTALHYSSADAVELHHGKVNYIYIYIYICQLAVIIFVYV